MTRASGISSHPMATPILMVLLPGLDGTGRLFEPLVAKAPPGFDIKVVGYT